MCSYMFLDMSYKKWDRLSHVMARLPSARMQVQWGRAIENLKLHCDSDGSRVRAVVSVNLERLMEFKLTRSSVWDGGRSRAVAEGPTAPCEWCAAAGVSERIGSDSEDSDSDPEGGATAPSRPCPVGRRNGESEPASPSRPSRSKSSESSGPESESESSSLAPRDAPGAHRAQR